MVKKNSEIIKKEITKIEKASKPKNIIEQSSANAPVDAKVELKAKNPKKPLFNFKLFGKWDVSELIFTDQSLKPYLNLTPVLVPYTAGRTVQKQFWKSKKPIIERLAGKIYISGHRGKKHKRTSGVNTGKINLAFRIIQKSFDIIERKTKINPVQIFVQAIEKGSPKEGITTIEYGGVRYPKAVDISPQRRVDLALRWITQGAYAASASKKTKETIWNTLAEEIILASQGDNKSNTVQKSIDLERQAASSR